MDQARAALAMYEVDEMGLDRLDRAILTSLVDKFQGGPVGLSTLALSVGEESETLELIHQRGEDRTVESIKTHLVDLIHRQCRAGLIHRDLPIRMNLRVISDSPEEAIGNARRST